MNIYLRKIYILFVIQDFLDKNMSQMIYTFFTKIYIFYKDVYFFYKSFFSVKKNFSI